MLGARALCIDLGIRLHVGSFLSTVGMGVVCAHVTGRQQQWWHCGADALHALALSSLNQVAALACEHPADLQHLPCLHGDLGAVTGALRAWCSGCVCWAQHPAAAHGSRPHGCHRGAWCLVLRLCVFDANSLQQHLAAGRIVVGSGH